MSVIAIWHSGEIRSSTRECPGAMHPGMPDQLRVGPRPSRRRENGQDHRLTSHPRGLGEALGADPSGVQGPLDQGSRVSRLAGNCSAEGGRTPPLRLTTPPEPPLSPPGATARVPLTRGNSNPSPGDRFRTLPLRARPGRRGGGRRYARGAYASSRATSTLGFMRQGCTHRPAARFPKPTCFPAGGRTAAPSQSAAGARCAPTCTRCARTEANVGPTSAAAFTASGLTPEIESRRGPGPARQGSSCSATSKGTLDIPSFLLQPPGYHDQIKGVFTRGGAVGGSYTADAANRSRICPAP